MADGGRGALERVRGARYDLIVSDIRMPDGDGEEFYRAAVAAQPALAGRFLFITGDTANPARLGVPADHARRGAREAVQARRRCSPPSSA